MPKTDLSLTDLRRKKKSRIEINGNGEFFLMAYALHRGNEGEEGKKLN